MSNKCRNEDCDRHGDIQDCDYCLKCCIDSHPDHDGMCQHKNCYDGVSHEGDMYCVMHKETKATCTNCFQQKTTEWFMCDDCLHPKCGNCKGELDRKGRCDNVYGHGGCFEEDRR